MPNDERVTVTRKGERRTKMWIVQTPQGSRGFPAHLYTKQEAIDAALEAKPAGEREWMTL